MEIKHREVLIDNENPFANCKLGRQKYASVLTTLVQSYADGFVLALNGEWGTGKTTFVRMWQASLENDGYKTLYFNAWENDFEHEPIIALLGELKELVGDKNKNYKSLLDKGLIFAKNILPAIAKGAIAHYIEADVAIDVLEKSIAAATEILEKEVNVYVNKKQGLVDFKNELECFIEKTNGGKPLIFIIDELDRCRPNYAVEILEKVKHFFNVKGIVFVLSIDKIQLGNSIQGFYGSSKLNHVEYLRRFIDIEYVLPKPDTKDFCNYLYEYYEFHDFFDSNARFQYVTLRSDGQRFLDFSNILFSTYKYTLRQQEKCFAHARIVLRSFSENSYVFPDLLILLIHIKERNVDFYNNLSDLSLSIQELVNEFERIFYSDLIEEVSVTGTRHFLYIESLIISFYSNSISRKRQLSSVMLIVKKDGVEELSFSSTIENETFKENLKYYILNPSSFDYHGYQLGALLKKIDLLDNIF